MRVIREMLGEYTNPSQEWFYGNYFVCRHRILDEEYPNDNVKPGYPPHQYDEVASYNILRDHYYRDIVTRFLAPGYYDSDPDGELGYWAVRVSWIDISAVIQIADETPWGDPVAQNQTQWDLWLLDTYFDYTAITWNNPPPASGLRLRVDVTGAAKRSYTTRTYPMFRVFLPLATDGRPVPIYGMWRRLRQIAGADTDIGKTDEIGDMPVDIAAVDARQALTPYAGEYLPKD